jgi:PAS domain S-box-containing protein
MNEASDAEKLFAVVQVSQRLCGQTDVDGVIRTFINGATAISSARRIRLLRREHEEFIVEYDAEASNHGVEIRSGGLVSECEESLRFALRNVLRTRSVVHFHNSPLGYGTVQRNTGLRAPLSPALCIPLTSGNQDLEILCLDRMPGDFPFEPTVISHLLLLSTQATVCLENLRYRAHIRAENIEREKVEMTLRASETALAEAQRMSRTGSWRWEVDTDTVQASVEFFRIYGLEFTPVSPRSTFTDLVHSDDIQALQRVVGGATAQGKSFRTEYRIHAASGDLKYLQNEGHPQIATDGTLYYVGIVMDTTERRNTEKALQATKAQLASALRLSTMGELAASIIHEINQPLTGIMANAQVCLRWLLHEPPQIDRAREAAKRLVGDAERAANVFRGLRALASKIGIVQVPVDIDDAIEEVALLLRGELERGNIRLEIRRGALRAVHGDRFQLQQVIENLMHNAIDAMLCVDDSPRRLTITSEPKSDGVAMVTVHDTGCGFGSHSPEELFDALFTTKPDGMGMGLKVCRSIIEAHSGKLVASSGTDGTKFQFTLPYVRSELHKR